MNFRIVGRAYEQDSGVGVPGLMIRAYDKDLLFDDLLGTAITDADGHFELRYGEKDFRELFERAPDIYLSVYAPPYRFLLDTQKAIRWNAGQEESFDIPLDAKTLGGLTPTRPPNQVGHGIALPKGFFKVEKRDGFDIPHLPGFVTTGIPGAPATPRKMQYVALPLGGDVLKLEVMAGEPVRIGGITKPMPAQAPFPDVGIDKETGGGFAIEDFPYQMTPADPRYLEGQTRYPEHLVELIRVEEIGPIQMAALEVRPVQYDARAQAYFYYPNLQYVVTFDREKALHIGEGRRKSRATVGELYSEHLNDMLSNSAVVAAVDLMWPWLVLEDIAHVIITDNYQWPDHIDLPQGTTRPPMLSERGAALTGDLVAEFQRLADWRTAHGIRSQVITISQIVGGTYGDFTQGGFARDLQEVIRNFLKKAHADWDTLYAVLGGDVNVVPMRYLTGCGGHGSFGVTLTNDNPPPVWKNHFLPGHGTCKLHPEFVPMITEPLSTYRGGVRVPYNREAGPGYLGWYFTTETDFNTKSEGFVRLPDHQPTQFVIVEGPDTVINDEFYWVRDVNSIPSDFYYASLVGPGYSIPGKHDFDDNNNGLYGQYCWNGSLGREVTLDEVDFYSDVWVGRVPAETGAQVRGFVDKVITYESLRSPGAAFNNVDPQYLRKVLYAADYWGRQGQSRQNNTGIPPAEGTFTHVGGTNETKIHTAFDMQLVSGNPSFRLVTRTGTTQTVIPYNTSASASSLGWYFTTSNTYSAQSSTPTRFVRVLGPEASINPGWYFWDPVGLELASHEKEVLRGEMNSWFPAFNNVQRHYSDYFDLTSPPPIVPLEETTLRPAINGGTHFLSLTGHGWWGGCCAINVAGQPDFSNQRQYFIAFADSCSTGRPDGVDSLGEVSVLDPDGGAVGYVGNTRYSWISVGDNYEQMFWCLLSTNARLGPAAGMRLATDGVRSLWTFYAQTLYGDPATPVYSKVPNLFTITVPELVQDAFILDIVSDRKPVRDVRVTVTGDGEKGGVFMSKKTESDGRVSFALPPEAARLETIRVTVATRDYQPEMFEIRVGNQQPPD